MALHRPILVIEDDPNDADVIETAITELGVKNEVKKFGTAEAALDYLMVTTDKPLVILCDIRMSGMDGLGLLKHICATEYLRRKSMPFVFLTAVATEDIINEAYDIGVQGFFKKGNTYTGIKDQLLSIIIYWQRCLHTNSNNISD